MATVAVATAMHVQTVFARVGCVQVVFAWVGCVQVVWVWVGCVTPGGLQTQGETIVSPDDEIVVGGIP